jgi:hypothetical protein
MADDGQWGPTIRAAELQGRHLGLFIYRKEISVEERHPRPRTAHPRGMEKEYEPNGK